MHKVMLRTSEERAKLLEEFKQWDPDGDYELHGALPLLVFYEPTNSNGYPYVAYYTMRAEDAMRCFKLIPNPNPGLT